MSGEEEYRTATPEKEKAKEKEEENIRPKLRKTVSLEEILFKKRKEKLFSRKHANRRSTQLTPRRKKRRGSEKRRTSVTDKSFSKYTVDNEWRRQSKVSYRDIYAYKDNSRRNSSYQDYRRHSSFTERNPSYKEATRRNSSRRSSHISSRKPSVSSRHHDYTEEEIKKYKHRKKIVITILLTFFVLSFISILTVVITLTHRSTAMVQTNNSTRNVTYYTFSGSADHMCREHGIGKLCS
uniref:Uncharacterized protein LOC114343173 n=1 Tax=Diabrotica virgifera virgifera TaxID=50390 RepID=A0A6P7GIN5_DIAVI